MSDLETVGGHEGVGGHFGAERRVPRLQEDHVTAVVVFSGSLVVHTASL